MTDPLNNSYYAATINGIEDRPALVGEKQADICVVGGGFTGLAAALACAEAGFSVVLLEAERVGFGASGRNGGQLIPGLRWTMQEVVAAFGDVRAQAIYDVAMTARDRVHTRIAQHEIACDVKHGHLEAAQKQSHFSAMCHDVDFLHNKFGYASPQIIAAKDMADHLDAPHYHGGVYDPAGGHFHPLNYACGLAAAAEKAGVQIFENSRVQRVENGTGATVCTAHGTVNARHAIVGCDSWMGDVLPSVGRFTIPIMNYNIATAPLSNADALLPTDAAVADSRFVLNYFRLSADKRMIFGGGEKYTTRLPRDIAAFVRQHMVDVFPALTHAKIDYAWGGAVAVTMNRLPHFGRTGNTYFAHGFSGHGALMTTLAGELIAEALRGTVERFDVMAGLPHRPFPGGKWLAQPLATLGLMWFALRDRL